MDLKGTEWDDVYCIRLAQDRLSGGPCEHDNEASSFMKGQLSDYKLFTKRTSLRVISFCFLFIWLYYLRTNYLLDYLNCLKGLGKIMKHRSKNILHPMWIRTRHLF